VKASLNIFCSSPQKILSINRYNQIKNHLAYSDDIEGKYDKESVSTYLEKFKDVLDEEEYKFLVFHLIYEFSYREIAKSYGYTTAKVSSKYQRGIKKLRDYYGGK
jgi:RNA polymerase sigma factor (sigma-70 family)